MASFVPYSHHCNLDCFSLFSVLCIKISGRKFPVMVLKIKVGLGGEESSAQLRLDSDWVDDYD